jgi:hypothetical protein
VNLVHAAFFHCEDRAGFIASLMDDLGRGRVEIDMIKFSEPAFSNVDNRLMSLQLVEKGLTDAAMFTAAFRGTEGVFVLVPPNFDPQPGFPEARAIGATLWSACSQGPDTAG